MNRANRKSGGNRWAHVDPWDRLMARTVRDESGCWIWTGSATKAGYGFIYLEGRRRQVHQVSWELRNGQPMPDGTEIDHLCRNPRCVNPDHLEPVERRVNIRRGMSLAAQRARQTHCKNGHEFTPENTRVSKRGERRCITCDRAYHRARYLARGVITPQEVAERMQSIEFAEAQV